MPTTTIANRFYPHLSNLITVDDLPEFLSFAENSLDSLLSSIFYKNFQFSKSRGGDGASFQLDLITQNVGLNLPFGLRLVLNPDTSGNSNISSFPISVKYRWQILAFLNSFNLSQFSFAPDAFYN